MAKLNEDVKVVMLKGEKGETGEAGQGIPSGGKTGQAIIKASDNDYDYKWGSLVVNDVANATNDGNGNNIVNTYATKTELNTAKTDASNTYLAKTDASNTYLAKTDVSNTYLAKTDLMHTISQHISIMFTSAPITTWSSNGDGTIAYFRINISSIIDRSKYVILNIQPEKIYNSGNGSSDVNYFPTSIHPLNSLDEYMVLVAASASVFRNIDPNYIDLMFVLLKVN